MIEKWYLYKNPTYGIDYDYCPIRKTLHLLPYLPTKEACQDVRSEFIRELHYIFDYNNIRLN